MDNAERSIIIFAVIWIVFIAVGAYYKEEYFKKDCSRRGGHAVQEGTQFISALDENGNTIAFICIDANGKII